MSKVLPKAIYVDALALVSAKKSGVGLTLKQTLQSLTKLKDVHFTIYLVVPLWKARYLREWTTPNVKTKIIPLPARLLSALLRLKLLPPVDWLLGNGIYVFPNYRNWPLWRSRSLTYVYDTSFLKYPETVQEVNRKYLQRHIRSWVGRADKIVTISEQVRDEIERLLDVHYSKISIVPCGVDAELFRRRDQSEVEAVKAKYKINFEKYLLYVGNIEPRKNLLALLEAYKNLPSGLQQAYGLVLVGGDGWSNQTVLAELDEMSQQGLRVLKVTDYVAYDDLPAIYSGASILVHPAIYEGFGITPLEAMACGTPVAVSKLPAIEEVVKDTGAYFNPNDPSSIQATIQKLLHNPQLAKENIRKGLSRAKELSWKSSAEKLYQTIEQEGAAGPHRHPLLSRLRSLYKRLDRGTRRLLGEYPVEAYRPPPVTNEAELRDRLYGDFLNEQPNRLQYALLTIYLGAKQAMAQAFRKMWGLVKQR